MSNTYYYKDGTLSSHLTRNYAKELHRVDGPAIEYADGDRHWCVNGKLHRVDGPAIENTNGSRWWYLDGVRYSEKPFNQLIREAKALPLALRLTDPREWVRNII